MSPSRHPMKALVVANQGLPKIIEWPLVGYFEWMTMKSIGYSHEANVTRMSSRMPINFMVVLSASVRTLGVG